MKRRRTCQELSILTGGKQDSRKKELEYFLQGEMIGIKEMI
jgi:hypothetical protein